MLWSRAVGAASGLCRSALCTSRKPGKALHMFLPRDEKERSDRKTLYPSAKAEHDSWTLECTFTVQKNFNSLFS